LKTKDLILSKHFQKLTNFRNQKISHFSIEGRSRFDVAKLATKLVTV